MNYLPKSLSVALLGAILSVAAVSMPAAYAADEHNVSVGATLSGPGLAVHGYDAVSFFSGSPAIGSDKFAVAHDGATYRFVNQANLDAFNTNPGRYEPAFGGFCAYGAALGKKFDGDPKYWRVVDGKLYLNLNADIQAKWSEDVPGNVKTANSNWTRIKSVAVDKL
jgi:YHS domain-containing protein